MNRILCFFLVLIMTFTASVSILAVSPDDTLLSDLSDEQCMAFLEDNNIEIPACYENEIDCVPFVRSLFEQIEAKAEKIALIRDPELFRFANDIKRAVEEFYGVTDVSTYVESYDSDIVEDSTKYGEWLASFANYNCYGYAIDDKTNFPKLCPGFSIWVDAGMTAASYPYNDEADIAIIADWVKQDLEEYYGYTVNSVSPDMPNTQVSGHTKLICVRKDLQDMPYDDGNGGYTWFQDFHFMRLDADGYWYHKPGLTGILKYNSIPSNEEVWVQEGYYVYGGVDIYYHYGDYTYESDIYFIEYTTPHQWDQITTNNNGTHTIKCSVCGEPSYEEDCELDYTCVNTYYHKGTCADCGYTTAKTSCQSTYSYVGNGSGKHTATCSVCNKNVTLQCSLEYIWYSGNQHCAVCSVCAKVFYEACDVSVTYTGNGTTSHTHTLGCDECGHVTGTVNTACTLSYVFAGTVNGTNTHHYLCTVCGHKAVEYALCMYKNGNTCISCGTSKDVTGTTATGEMESAE